MARTPRFPGRPTSTRNPSALLFNPYPLFLPPRAPPPVRSQFPNPNQAATVGPREREKNGGEGDADAARVSRRRPPAGEEPRRHRRRQGGVAAVRAQGARMPPESSCRHVPTPKPTPASASPSRERLLVVKPIPAGGQKTRRTLTSRASPTTTEL